MLLNVVLACALVFSFVEAAKLPRVAGGHDVDISKISCLVRLHDRGSYKCGATIISSHWAITAAQCVEGNRNVSTVTLHEGSSRLNEEGTVHHVADLKYHEDYDPVTFENDIAVIEVKEPFNSKPCQLAASDSDCAENAEAEVCGWGFVDNQGPLSNNLRAAEVPIWSNSDCQKAYPGGVVSQGSICTGVKEGGIGPCLGDGGCPLLVGNKVCGAASWAFGCGEKGYPAVYTRISTFREWIEKNSGI